MSEKHTAKIPNLSKSALKKLNKKVQKAKLSYSNLIGFSDDPTEILLLTNGGLKNDVSRECLEAVLNSTSIEYIDLIMTREHTFSILIFHNLESSIEAYQLLHGYELKTPELVARPTVSLCATFIKNAPTIIDNVKHFEKMNELPDGLIIHYDVVSDEEAHDLVEDLLKKSDSAICHNSLKHRFVKHFGYEFLYDSNKVDPSQPLKDSPIPKLCKKLTDRFCDSFLQHRPNQLTVNVYEPGQGIPPHVDTHSVFEDEIVSLSLLSDIVMQFTNPLTSHVQSLVLPKNSLLIMRGECRYLWKHSITPRKYDLIQNKSNKWTKVFRDRRVSLTFRKVKEKPNCCCKWSTMCDFQSEKTEQKEIGVNKVCLDNPTELENKYVKEVYENIASHFSSTRHSGWPAVMSFLKDLNPGELLLDVGCGNGKYLNVNPDLIVLSSDFSHNLCRICQTKGGDPIQADMLRLPYRCSLADSAICIAAIHHLSTDERRLAAINEIASKLRPDGRAMITVWALEQNHRGKDSNYICQHKEEEEVFIAGDNDSKDSDASSSSLKVHVNRTKFRDKDMLVPWHNKTSAENSSNPVELYHRYYHLFSAGELEELCQQTDKLLIDKSFYDQGNWCVIVRRC